MDMDVHTRCVAILLFFVSDSSVVVAAENAQQLIFMQVGKPTSTQNVNITTVDLKYHNMFWSWGQAGCQFGLGARVGWFEVANESTARLGGGGRIGCQWGHWQTWVPLEMVWLEQHSFGERGVAFKDYGGPFQFVRGLGVGYAFNEQWSLGYQFEHMSNWHMYEPNPALNSHNLVVSYRF
jgi:hypothetical protein